jgi:monoamine oxidase
VLISGYAVEGSSEFGKLPTTAAKLAASRAAVEKLHPGRSQELAKPVYVSWGRIPYNLGSWVSGSLPVDGNKSTYYEGAYREFISPDDRIYFAGDHCSHIVAWQEGAALSAQRAVSMIAERIHQG